MNIEERQLEDSQSINLLLLEMVKNQRSNMKNIIRVFVITVICYTILLISMIAGFFWYESQFTVYEEVITTTTTTQEVSGEGSEINNVQGDMYNDNSTHTE